MSITREFLRHPMLTGAVAASSPKLAEAMTTGLGLENARLVVELGPGTGVFTGAVLSRLPPGARLVAVEINPRLAGILRERYPEVEIVQGSAENLDDHVREAADVVVSGLPWTVMTTDRQERILDRVTEILVPNGRFTTFAYVHAAWAPPGRRFAAALRDRFAVTGRSPVVWPNLPPAFVHRAALPVSASGSRPSRRRREGKSPVSIPTP
ncbi:methyltransferase domain-containing protein [Amycolatopsis roodepoortensis]|uniref:class I SAM-dependent methyltransferase n=1 Tax=Amycolatopsis roodepoortensis TaxID=700274 RepID=UPI00214B0AD5|nr:methyltransferase domain-containing protein [Amycolatopsis roodepoortensis]UUV29199.1 methyltransferase domain-containing protein [Amycolatopsis roodepoortensis]